MVSVWSCYTELIQIDKDLVERGKKYSEFDEKKSIKLFFVQVYLVFSLLSP